MVISSAKKTCNATQRQGNYEVDDIIFATKFVYRTIKSIDKNLRLLYTPGSEINDWDTINFSPLRNDEEEFDYVLLKIEERIGRIIAIDDGSTRNFLHKEKRKGAFLRIFRGIEDCINEGVHSPPQNNFDKRIRDIVRGFTYIGINPYYYT